MKRDRGFTEIEIRGFVSDNKYRQLLAFLRKNCKFVSKDDQVTYYFDKKGNIRIQKNDFFAKLWIKSGKLHTSIHRELEVKFDKNDFGKLEEAMLMMGFAPKIKWFRLRYTFRWGGMNVMLDKTKGYGNIIELEMICSSRKKEVSLKALRERARALGVKETPSAEFERRYKYYERNWRRLAD
jgi:predicted adenylyl cyclase CyaB